MNPPVFGCSALRLYRERPGSRAASAVLEEGLTASETGMQEHAEKPFRHGSLWIALGLVIGVLAIYGQTLHFDFVGYDDDQYLTANPSVRAGLSSEGVVYAFSRGRLQEGHPFHPITWLSHMLDVELFGLAAGGHHATNVLLHALASVLLFAALSRLTGAPWRSAAAAALWAWHPLRVESVAWISERKDVLSGVFAMLTLVCYARYVRRESRAAWWGAILSFGLGLMSKPTLVPLPFALLLLDYWPLARQRTFARLVIEKLPLFALSALSSGLTVYFHLGWMAPVDAVSPLHRAANAVVAVARYLEQLVWPVGLAPLYPHPYLPAHGGVPLDILTIALAAALVVVLTLAAWLARRQPHLALGWLWFLGMLVPTIGLVQVGSQAHADRYTYLPMIGLSVALVWGAADLIARVRAPALRRGLAVAAVGALVGYGAVAFVQTQIWRESETLFRHTLAVSPRATVMHLNLGGWLRVHRQFDAAAQQYRTGLAIDPGNATLHFDLGRALHAQGNTAAAVAEYRAAAASDPRDPRPLYQLGVTYELAGRLAEAIEHYRRAIEIDPNNPKPRERLAAAQAKHGLR